MTYGCNKKDIANNTLIIFKLKSHVDNNAGRLGRNHYNTRMRSWQIFQGRVGLEQVKLGVCAPT